ncbi:MAG: hypothetical protein LBI45_07185 [Bacteroidales bacterium]|jgi:hypothetical protein|nr:hypothetical protein [Bacteroidales bacterium]
MKKYFLILLVFLSSCNCQKQLAKLRYKCPELFTIDTVTKSVVIEEYKYDSIYLFPPGYKLEMPLLQPLIFPITGKRITGNIIIDSNRVKTNLIIPAETITVEIPIEKVIPCNRKHFPEDYAEKQRKTKRNFYLLGVGTVAVLIIIRKIIKLYLK